MPLVGGQSSLIRDTPRTMSKLRLAPCHSLGALGSFRNLGGLRAQRERERERERARERERDRCIYEREIYIYIYLYACIIYAHVLKYIYVLYTYVCNDSHVF